MSEKGCKVQTKWTKAALFKARMRGREIARGLKFENYEIDCLRAEVKALKEQIAVANGRQIIAYYDFDIEGGTYLVDTNYYLTHREEIESRGWKMKPLRDNYTLTDIPEADKEKP